MAIDALDLIGQHGTRDQESVQQNDFERAAKFMIAKAAVIKWVASIWRPVWSRTMRTVMPKVSTPIPPILKT
jgi:hypothetical protein